VFFHISILQIEKKSHEKKMAVQQQFQHNVKRTYNVLKNKRIFQDTQGCVNGDGQGSVRNYKKIKNKSSMSSLTSTTTKSTSTPGFSMNFSFNLLPQLTDEYRQRHSLSLNDYRKIFRATDVNYLWMMAIYNGLEVTTSAIQSSSSAPNSDTVTYSGNTQFKTKLEKFLSLSKNLSSTDRLIAKRDKHKPPLPVHFVSEDTLRSLPAPKNHYTHLYKWKDIYLLPFSYYNGYYKMIAVIPRHIYEMVYSKAKNLLSEPFEYLVDGMVYAGTSEYLLLQTKENHAILSNMTNNREIKEFENCLYLKK
jgi:hypothetical protein